MVKSLRYFEGGNVFQRQEESDSGTTADELTKPISLTVRELYDGIALSCLKRAKGNQKDADYLFDCGYFEYYYRVGNYNTFVEQTKPNTTISDDTDG